MSFNIFDETVVFGEEIFAGNNYYQMDSVEEAQNEVPSYEIQAITQLDRNQKYAKMDEEIDNEISTKSTEENIQNNLQHPSDVDVNARIESEEEKEELELPEREDSEDSEFHLSQQRSSTSKVTKKVPSASVTKKVLEP